MRPEKDLLRRVLCGLPILQAQQAESEDRFPVPTVELLETRDVAIVCSSEKPLIRCEGASYSTDYTCVGSGTHRSDSTPLIDLLVAHTFVA